MQSHFTHGLAIGPHCNSIECIDVLVTFFFLCVPCVKISIAKGYSSFVLFIFLFDETFLVVTLKGSSALVLLEETLQGKKEDEK